MTLTMSALSKLKVLNTKYKKFLLSMSISILAFSFHIDYIKTKAWARIHVMRRLKFSLDRIALEIVYVSFVRPILEYAGVLV